MRWVQQAALSPHRCAVLPYVGNSSTTKGFLDTGVDVDDIYRIYLSGEFFEHVIPQMGFVPEGQLEGLQNKNAELQAQIDQLKAEKAELKDQIDAVAVLTSAGYRGSKQTGRPPKQKVS